nr:hypothetical protein CFP56_31539 [Quercus suber]
MRGAAVVPTSGVNGAEVTKLCPFEASHSHYHSGKVSSQGVPHVLKDVIYSDQSKLRNPQFPKPPHNTSKMQFSTLALAVLSVGVATTQAAVCFDAGDCLFNGGGQCVRTAAAAILGTCASTGTATATATSSASTAKATGAICFDAGDCILSGGGQCIKPANAILGNCAPAAKAARSPEPFVA